MAAPILPAPQRDRLAFRLDLPLTTWAATFSLAAAAAGGIAWALGWFAWMESATSVADHAAANGAGEATLGGLMYLGPLQALAYLFTPLGAGLGYLTLSGLVRCGVWVATREVPGDPIATLVLAVGRALRRLRERRRAGALFGELPADLVRETGEGSLEIVCAQARRDLAVGASVELRGRFYEVARIEAGRMADRTTVVYCLRALPPESVLRGLVRYRPR
jgi:hypothetical protein